MRYTESRLTRFAQVLLSELEQGTVEWGQNFDGTMKEPKLMPARLPHVLLNGASGIAVGMATDIPPHNVREIVGACLELLDNPVSPRGYRLLARVPRLPASVVERLVEHFGGLQKLLAASIDDLQAVEGVGELRARSVREGLSRLAESSILERYV